MPHAKRPAGHPAAPQPPPRPDPTSVRATTQTGTLRGARLADLRATLGIGPRQDAPPVRIDFTRTVEASTRRKPAR
jgi:hypothetical protein